MSKFEEIKSINLIKDIKSFYNLERIFSFLEKKPKLNMMIYNKKLQEMFSVKIEDYKIISGRYRIIEINGKGKEYILNTNNLLFEGEYKNRKRNGYGKEYYDKDKIKFEGEYLNGKRWNVKGYNIKGKIDFLIKDGKGIVKEYKNDGKLEFEGEYINGERNGKGKEYYNDGKL